jgi:hypothetical protein
MRSSAAISNRWARVQRVVLAAALVAEGLVLDPAPDLVERRVGDTHHMEALADQIGLKLGDRGEYVGR